MSVVSIVAVRTESCDLHETGIGTDGDRAVFDAGRNTVREELHHFFRPGCCGNIPVIRLCTEDKIAHASAHDTGRVAVDLQRSQNAAHIFWRCHINHGNSPESPCNHSRRGL